MSEDPRDAIQDPNGTGAVDDRGRGPLRADVVVVGAGLTGVVTAQLLADGGVNVVVLAAGASRSTTTARWTGKLSVLQGTRLTEIARHGDEVVAAYLAANLAGLDWLRRTLPDRDVAVEDRDDLTVASAPEQVADVEAVHPG